MKFNGSQEVDQNTLVGHALCHLAEGSDFESATVPGVGVMFDVVLTINGKERDFRKFLSAYQEVFDAAVETRARSLLVNASMEFREKEDLLHKEFLTKLFK